MINLSPEKGPSAELLLYMARVEFVRDKILGLEFRNSIERADQIDRNVDPEEAEPLFSRAFDLLCEGWERVRINPEAYTNLVEWSEEETLYGCGRPSVKEALVETCINDLLDEYPDILGRLAEKHKEAGRHTELNECRSRLQQVHKFATSIGINVW